MKNWFKTPTAQEMAKRELEEAKRELLVAETAVEQWMAKRTAIQTKIARLSRMEGVK